jgi:hypothetical protein
LGLCPLVPCGWLVTKRSQMQPTAVICRWSRDRRGMDFEAFPQVSLRKQKGLAPAASRPPAAPLARDLRLRGRRAGPGAD